MHAPPRLRGGLAVRLAFLFGGLLVCACAITSIYESKLGLAPWDVLHQGIARHTPLTFGEANIAVGVVVVALAWLLGAQIGLGTVANATLIGVFIQLLTSVGWIAHISRDGMGARVVALLGGIGLMAVGTALYMAPSLGAGPRDSLMLVVTKRTGVRIGVVRAALELSVLVVGFVLGGKVGLGTLAFAVLIGPGVEACFWLLQRTPVTLPAPPRPAASTAVG